VTAGISIQTGSVVEANSNSINGQKDSMGVMVIDLGSRATLRQLEIQGVSNGLVVAEGAQVDFVYSILCRFRTSSASMNESWHICE